MTIQEAVKKAVEIGGFITVPELVGHIKIKPTDTADCCIPCHWDGSYPSRRWNPTANDLMRDDWLVIEENLLPGQ